MKNRYKVVLSFVLVSLFVASVMVYDSGGLAGTGRANVITSAPMTSSGPLVQVQGASANGSLTKIGNFELLSEPSQFNPSANAIVTLSLKPTGNLAGFISDISDPVSSHYRQYVTASDLGNMFGVSQQSYNAMTAYFQSFGISVLGSSTKLSMTLSGTVSSFESAFHTTIGAYAIQYTSAGMWIPMFGNGSAVPGSVTTSPIQYVTTAGMNLPSGIAQFISGITGLDGMVASPDLMLPYGMSPAVSPDGVVATNPTASGNFSDPYPDGMIQGINDANFTWAPNSNTPTDASYENPTGGYQFLFPSTMHVLTGASNLWSGASAINGVPDMGQGVTIAVIEVGDIPLSYLQEFGQQVWNNPNQVTGRLSTINLLGANLISGFEYGWTGETALDIEYIAAMAPMAHIDLVAVPTPEFSAFDYAYQYIAQHLTSGNNATDSITITSNSYGSGEEYTAFFGAPMYMTVENTLLSELNAVGVTNFFATGDYGSYASEYEYGATSAGMPAIANGSTSVGGGQLTAESNGVAFPETGVYAYNNAYGVEMQVAPATGVQSFTYWSYGYGESGTEKGAVGGGFGQSIMTQQPWWQNALDTYSSGARMDPVVSGSAAFNMSIYEGFWEPFYGGTSFATPITAGEWALVEEQANLAFGSTALGDINPSLYAAHNAYEAGASGVQYNPFTDMTNIGMGFNYGPTNSYDWYYFNLSINVPSDPIVPWWIFTLSNPAGQNWNYLQGLGMINVGAIDSDLIGNSPAAHNTLLNEPFKVMLVSPQGPGSQSSTYSSFQTLNAGKTYTFQVILANGVPGGNYQVAAYSGGSNSGMYGGGSLEMITTNQNGIFTYTPTYNMSSPSPAASEYGYFLVKSVSSKEWSFSDFAVVQPPLKSGTLTLGVTDAQGILQTSVAEVPMFMDTQTGYYNDIGATGEVMLNGNPVSDAVVHEISVNNSLFLTQDPTLPVSSYAPGIALGTFLSDGRGMFNYWTDAPLAEISGTLYTQVEQLYATYNGLTSNTVTVYIEPQTGSFYTNVALNRAGNALVGTVTFSDMKYVSYVNVSIGSGPGQYVNESFAPQFTDTLTGMPVSGVFNGVIPIDFTSLPANGPVVVSMVAEGYNDLSFIYSFLGFTFGTISVQNHIVWADPLVIQQPDTHNVNSLPGNSPYSFMLGYEGAMILGTVSAIAVAGGLVLIKHRKK